MRRLQLLIALLMLAAPALAADWYVRQNGGTTTQCTGHSDVDYDGSGTGEPCAYASCQDAIGAMNCATPDHVYIRSNVTCAGAITTPDPCVAPSDANRAIIEGPDDDTSVLSGGAIADTLTLVNGDTTMGSANRFLTIKGLKILCSDDRCIQATGTWEGITIEDNTFEHDGGGSSNASGNANVIGMAALAGHWGHRIIGNRATGTEGLSRAGLTGTDAVFIRQDEASSCASCTLEKGIYLANNTMTNFHGALFDGNCTGGRIQGNRITSNTCRGDENACIQVYNSIDCQVIENLAENIKPDGSLGLRFIQARTTDETSGKKASFQFVNNTLVGVNSATSSTSVKVGIEINSVLDRASAKTIIANNIITRNIGRNGISASGDRAPIMIQDCSDNGVDILNNMMDNNAWGEGGGTTPDDTLHYGFGAYTEGFPSGCTTHTDSGNLWDTPPSLETTNWTPDASNDPSCGAGTTSITLPAQANQPAWTSHFWIGYAQGSCLSGTSSVIKGAIVRGGTIR